MRFSAVERCPDDTSAEMDETDPTGHLFGNHEPTCTTRVVTVTESRLGVDARRSGKKDINGTEVVSRLRDLPRTVIRSS